MSAKKSHHCERVMKNIEAAAFMLGSPFASTSLSPSLDKESVARSLTVFDHSQLINHHAVHTNDLYNKRLLETGDPVSLKVLLAKTLVRFGSENFILKENELDELLEQRQELTLEKQIMMKSSQGEGFEKVIFLDQQVDAITARIEKNLATVADLSHIDNLSLVAGCSAKSETYLDDLILHLANVAVTKDLKLPELKGLTDEGVSGKIQWLRECFDFLASSHKGGSLKDFKDNGDVAFKDLQFAHNYLTKQFQEERDNYHSLIKSLKAKFQNQRDMNVDLNKKLTHQTEDILEQRLQLEELNEKVNKQKDEIFELSKSNKFLQIDQLGSPASEGDNSPGSNYSVSILRTEFKRIVGDINDTFTKKLQEEQVERQRLEKLVKAYEGRA